MTSNENPSSAETPLNALDQVRDLVFGQQMKMYENRFARTTAQLNETKTELVAMNEASSRALTEDMIEREKRLFDRIAFLEKELNEARNALNAKIAQLDERSSANLRKEASEIRREHVNRLELSAFFMEMGRSFAADRDPANGAP